MESVKAFNSFTYFSISEYIHWLQSVSLLYTGSAMCICAYIYISKHSMFIWLCMHFMMLLWSSGQISQLYQNLLVSQFFYNNNAWLAMWNVWIIPWEKFVKMLPCQHGSILCATVSMTTWYYCYVALLPWQHDNDVSICHVHLIHAHFHWG